MTVIIWILEALLIEIPHIWKRTRVTYSTYLLGMRETAQVYTLTIMGALHLELSLKPAVKRVSCGDTVSVHNGLTYRQHNTALVRVTRLSLQCVALGGV